MADDADITKLPLEDRLVHKVKDFAPQQPGIFDQTAT